MEIINFLKEYWVLITFFVGEIGVVWAFVRSIIKGIKCSLRNDILNIYDRCKTLRQSLVISFRALITLTMFTRDSKAIRLLTILSKK